jgi:hypothetical protein
MQNYYWHHKWDGYGAETSLETILQYIGLKHRDPIFLFRDDRIVELGAHFSELWHKCSEAEWERLIDHIANSLGIDPRETEYELDLTKSERVCNWIRKLLGKKPCKPKKLA